MKQHSKLLLFILILSFAVSTAFFCYRGIAANAASYTVVYVKDGGSGNGSGNSAGNAISTIKAAVTKLGTGNGIIVLCGPTSVGEFAEPTHKGHVIITSLYNGVDYRSTSDAALLLNNKYILGGPVTFENLTVQTDGSTRLFFGNGYPLEFGEGVECSITKENGTTYPYVFGGNNNKTSGTLSGASVTISSGHFSKVSGGYRYAGGTINGDISVTINGGTVDTYVNGSGVGTVNGDVTVTVNGGRIDHGVYGIDSTSDRKTTVTGDVSVTVNGGDIRDKIAAAKNDSYATLNGAYNCNINTEELDYVTDIRGALGIA